MSTVLGPGCVPVAAVGEVRDVQGWSLGGPMSSTSDLNEDELFSISEDSEDSEEDAQRGG